MGTLYLVSTPVGNLEDLSARTVRILGEVDAVLAEDTRRTRRLLHHLSLTTPLVSLHEHNEEERSGDVLDRLGRGQRLALVSDAGTPLVSDPGERLVRRVIDGGHDVIPVPGPSAVLHALVGSGLPTTPFAFLGFAPRKGTERKAFLGRIADSVETVVVFEAPRRVGALLRDLRDRCGDGRRAVVARELTKIHEEFRRGTLGELASYYQDEAPRGEVTVIVAPVDGDRAGSAEAVDSTAERGRRIEAARALLAEGVSASRAARELASMLGIPRNEAYDLVHELAHGGPNANPDADVNRDAE